MNDRGSPPSSLNCPPTPGTKGVVLPFLETLRLHQSGAVDQAAAAYQQILCRDPTHAGAWHLLGVARQQQGRYAEAETCLAKALTLEPSKAVYRNNHGVALRSLGRAVEAMDAFEQALLLNPSYADAHSNLGLARRDAGDLAGAEAAFRQALALFPDHLDALFNLANLLHDAGRSVDAVTLYRRLLRSAPDHAPALNNLANALLALRQPKEAVACYERVAALDPQNAEAHLNLGTARAALDQVEPAAGAWAIAAALCPDKPLWRLKRLGLCPSVFNTAEEIDHYRFRLDADLDAALRTQPYANEADLVRDGFVPSFNLAHHGCCNRPLLEKYAALFRPLVRFRPAHPVEGKPRVGFVVTSPHAGQFLRTMGGVVNGLNPDRFAAVVLCSEKILTPLRKGLPRPDLEWAPFPDRLDQAADRVAAAGCGVLYFHKVSADPLGYLLPFARLASVQCTSWSTHGTSGVAEVDHYLSYDLIETDQADADYTEALIRLGTFPAFEHCPPTVVKACRADFGLPEPGGMYLCPQRPAKFHPDDDELLRGVLEADPQGHLVLVGGSDRLAPLLARFQRTLGTAARRVLVLPELTPDNLRRLLSVGDALLDLRHYSACLLAYDAFAAGLTIVTLPGRLKVERYALAFYRKLGLAEPVAATVEEYVSRAVRLGNDPDYRHSLNAELSARKDVLFDDVQTVREYERYFEDALARDGPPATFASCLRTSDHLRRP